MAKAYPDVMRKIHAASHLAETTRCISVHPWPMFTSRYLGGNMFLRFEKSIAVVIGYVVLASAFIVGAEL